ncbi:MULTISPECIES: hypothetical protein [unclassified Streptomyces]|uniref:hypothetical protein n=1 Tax=unclassified Streptomyces TaxID=2593676 RepID=UPI00081ED9BA|nr:MULTISPECIES: hypothetical protein [unclassified Streptomyces]MYR94773.1 hypothetical protein [Streptomyces sp. SID4937]SCD77848.1 hypothetical protein GA0115243_104222 [Streptomyces sp. ScaeMP-e83]
MDLETLRHGNFAQLNEAITAWKGVVDKLKALDTDARDDLKAKADKANWAGLNATVSREFITKTAGEFSDAHTQATTIHNILKDTRDELVEYKTELDEALERGRKKNITVVPTGNGGFTVTMVVHPDRAAKGTQVADHSQQDVDHLRDDVQRILNRATESDTSAAKVLKAIADQAEVGFSGAQYKDRDSAADALKKAEEAAKLIKDKGDEMTPEEFRNLNSTLGAYKNDPLFQEKFATTLGPKGVLEFWADLTEVSSPDDLARTQLNQLGDFQKNLGLTLAGATQSDSPAMRAWENDMVKFAGERYQTRGSQVWGFQLMSNLMRVGDYDDSFLNKYGNALVETEKKMKLPGNFWSGGVGGPNMPKMNFMSDEDFGRDPMTGFMTALANSPDASTEFFNAKEPQDNAEWVLKERKSFDDTPLDDGPNPALEATGKAMFAAVSGISDPEAGGATFVEHTEAHREALKRSLGFLAETGDDFPPELRRDMAWALGNHGETVHKVMSDPLGSSVMDEDQLLEVTKQISRNKDSYALLNEQMNYAILADINLNKEHPEDTLRDAGRTVGFLEQARQLTINTDESKDLRDTSWDQRWGYHVVGAIANQFGGDIAQRGVDAITAAWAEEEGNRIGEKATDDRKANHEERNLQLRAIADHWYAENSEWAENEKDFSKDRGVYTQIRDAADHGNHKADGVGGEK